MYFFDDLPGEFFLSMMEYQIYEILENVFTFEQVMRIRGILSTDEGFPQLITKIAQDQDVATLYRIYSDWLDNRRAIGNFLENLFVYEGTMLFELNKMLLVLYQEGTEKKLNKVMISGEYARLSQAVILHSKRLKRERGLDYSLP